MHDFQVSHRGKKIKDHLISLTSRSSVGNVCSVQTADGGAGVRPGALGVGPAAAGGRGLEHQPRACAPGAGSRLRPPAWNPWAVLTLCEPQLPLLYNGGGDNRESERQPPAAVS